MLSDNKKKQTRTKSDISQNLDEFVENEFQGDSLLGNNLPGENLHGNEFSEHNIPVNNVHANNALKNNIIDKDNVDASVKSQKKKNTKTKTVNFNHGHRQRLRDRFNENGIKALQDYEILELILFRSIPRKDVKPIAKELLVHFKNIKEVFNADENELCSVKGISANVASDIKLIFALTLKLTSHDFTKQALINNWESLITYLNSSLGHLKHEELKVLFLNKKLLLIKDETLQKGSVDSTPFYPREIIKRAMELGASSLIVVHNHPSGDPTPSVQDINITKQLVEGCKTLNLKLIDHIIIAKGRHVSFRNLQLL